MGFGFFSGSLTTAFIIITVVYYQTTSLTTDRDPPCCDLRSFGVKSEMKPRSEIESDHPNLCHYPSWKECLIFGGISSCVGMIFTSPLDFMKIRSQANVSSAVAKRSISAHAIQLYKTEGGLRPFFKGIQPSLIGTVPHRAIYFCSYHRYKDWFEKESCFNTLSAGTFASLTANTFISPLYIVKAKAQLNIQRNSFTYHCKDVIRQNGPKGFYRGFTATCAGSVGECACFLIYKLLKSYLAKSNQQPAIMQCMIASGTAKLISALVFYPTEVVRLQLQQDSTKSYQQILLNVRRDKSFIWLYRGLQFQLPKIVLSTMVMFGTFELLINCTHRLLHSKGS